MMTRATQQGRGLSVFEILDRSGNDGGLPLQVGLSIARQLVDILATDRANGAAATERLCPKTIFVSVDGQVRFEKIRNRSDASLDEEAARYAPPEQGDAGRLDHRSDLYRVGIILYEMLSGRQLDEGDKDPPPDLGEERNDAPPELVELFFELLCKDPAARPESMVEVVTRLDELIEDRIAWEGELKLEDFLREIATDDELKAHTIGPHADDDVAPSSSWQEQEPPTTRQRAKVLTRRDAVVVALLLTLSAAAGWVARIIFP